VASELAELAYDEPDDVVKVTDLGHAGVVSVGRRIGTSVLAC